MQVKAGASHIEVQAAQAEAAMQEVKAEEDAKPAASL